MTDARQKRIALEAANWVVKFDGVAFNARDVAAFKLWLHRSPDHRTAFEAASRTWNKLDLLSKLESFELPANQPGAFDRRTMLAGAGAAAMVIGASGYALLASGSATAYETGTGEQRDLTLDDGTRVTLGAATRIDARIGARERSIRVVRGETLISIAPIEGKLLSVSTTAGTVEAASGEVLVKILPQHVRISLLTGSAQARRGGLGNDQPIVLEPRSEIEFGPREVHISRADAPLLARRTLWREGRIAFDNTPLWEAAADVTRHSGARFEFADANLADLRIGGLIDAGDVDAFVSMLRNNLAIEATRRSDGVIELRAIAPSPPR